MRPARRPGSTPPNAVLVVLALLAALLLSGCANEVELAEASAPLSSTGPAASAASAVPARPDAGAPSPFATAAPAGWSGGTAALADLPAEAAETLALVGRGGPFPYEQDGATFHNREGLLPDQPAGYYAEYTVETPGSPDRGARRLVVGEGRYVYWTDDHYDSFRFVIP